MAQKETNETAQEDLPFDALFASADINIKQTILPLSHIEHHSEPDAL